jgi:hypothetical protein
MTLHAVDHVTQFQITQESSMATTLELPLAISDSPFTTPDWALSLLYAVAGSSLGVVAGVALGFVTMPFATSVNSGDLVQTRSTAVESRIEQSANLNPSGDFHPAAVVRLAATTPQEGDRRLPVMQHVIRSKASIVPKSLVAGLAHAAGKQAKTISSPLAETARANLASASAKTKARLSNTQSSLDTGVAAISFFTEGFSRIVDYDASAGTVETSEGRTFLILAPGSVSNSSSWQDYRSSVQYRCGSDGSCTLKCSGMVTLNARLIS